MSKTRIIESVKNLDLETTATLLDADPSLLRLRNHQGRNLLHLACSASCTKLKLPEALAARMVKFLLDRGLDIEEEGLSGRDPCKPIWFAVAFGRNPTVVKLLIKRGAVPTGLFAAGWWDDTAGMRKDHGRTDQKHSLHPHTNPTITADCFLLTCVIEDIPNTGTIIYHTVSTLTLSRNTRITGCRLDPNM